jgi:uncharacterized membrane protein YbhN (UPF0104 family)
VRVGAWAKIGISSGAVAVILWRVPLGALSSAFAGLSDRWLWAALASVLAMLAVRWYRWYRLLAAGGVDVGSGDSARSLLAGFALSIVTPGRLGELGRCLFVSKSYRAPVFLLNILDRALDMWALLTCAVASLMALAPRPYGVFSLGVWLALLPAVLGLPNLVTRLSSLPWWEEDFRQKLRLAGQAVHAVPTTVFAAWALVSTLLDSLTFFFLLGAFHHVSLRAALLTFPWIATAAGLPLSVSGLGPREAVAALLLAPYAIPSAVACDVGLLLFAFSALLPALIGGAWLAAAPTGAGRRCSDNLEAWSAMTRGGFSASARHGAVAGAPR